MINVTILPVHTHVLKLSVVFFTNETKTSNTRPTLGELGGIATQKLREQFYPTIPVT